MEMILDWKSIGSLLATLIFLRSAARDFLPPELYEFILSFFRRLAACFDRSAKIIIAEYESSNYGHNNELYTAAQTYLGSRCLADAPVVRLSKRHDSPLPAASLPGSHTTVDTFNGIRLQWSSHVEQPQQSSASPFGHRSPGLERRSLELSFHRHHRELVRSAYIPYVLEEAERIRLKFRERRLYTNRLPDFGDDCSSWSPVPFSHPSTFDTLAIAPAMRDEIRADLERFAERKDYYARVGRAWKRGYLLYGPPGTGKTSLIAAIANFLDFDVYDLELTSVTSNTHLRRLLVSTTPRSVLVIEDVDCSLDLSDRKKKRNKPKDDPDELQMLQNSGSYSKMSTLNLSGMLNFVDGLWSSCVGERLIIFTTNHPERLDSALLRPGRMDKHIHLSYCELSAFRVLVRNYLRMEEEHELMPEAETLLREVQMTPAEIAEVFVGCDTQGDGVDVAMQKVVEKMRRKKEAPPSKPADDCDKPDEVAVPLRKDDKTTHENGAL